MCFVCLISFALTARATCISIFFQKESVLGTFLNTLLVVKEFIVVRALVLAYFIKVVRVNFSITGGLAYFTIWRRNERIAIWTGFFIAISFITVNYLILLLIVITTTRFASEVRFTIYCCRVVVPFGTRVGTEVIRYFCRVTVLVYVIFAVTRSNALRTILVDKYIIFWT